eukprot:10134118-Alexandrium_andersonii.AAC.1
MSARAGAPNGGSAPDHPSLDVVALRWQAALELLVAEPLGLRGALVLGERSLQLFAIMRGRPLDQASCQHDF